MSVKTLGRPILYATLRPLYPGTGGRSQIAVRAFNVTWPTLYEHLRHGTDLKIYVGMYGDTFRNTKRMQELLGVIAKERRTLNMNEDAGGDYNTECPHCGGGIVLRFFVGSCHIPVKKDGWCYLDGPCDSSEEEFACGECMEDISSDYVHKVIDAETERLLTKKSKGDKYK